MCRSIHSQVAPHILKLFELENCWQTGDNNLFHSIFNWTDRCSAWLDLFFHLMQNHRKNNSTENLAFDLKPYAKSWSVHTYQSIAYRWCLEFVFRNKDKKATSAGSLLPGFGNLFIFFVKSVGNIRFFLLK